MAKGRGQAERKEQEMAVNGLIIGLDLCDAYTQVTCSGKEKVWTFPTVICRRKGKDEWMVGEDGYRLNLSGEGVIVDKLLSLAKKGGTATIEEVKYTGRQLLRHFLEQALALPRGEYGLTRIAQLVITLPDIDLKVMDCLLYCTDDLNIPRNRFHVISHSESFIYHVLSQKKEVWANQVGMFDLSQSGLRYYEMKIQRGIRQTMILADYENLDEGFNLDVLETASGAKLADKILCACGERLLARKLYSSILLTGKGFENPKWAASFMRLICKRRKVYAESGLFAKGAAVRAGDFLGEESSFPFVMICEGRLKSTVSMEVLYDGKPTPYVLAASGDSWYEAKSTTEVILDHQKEVVLQVQPVDSKRKKEIPISLEGFPDRPNRTTRIRMRTGFVNESTMAVIIQDKGFGELFAASDAVIRREIEI